MISRTLSILHGDIPAVMFFSTSNQTSSSTPTDMTPPAIKGLQGPFAAAISNLFGTGGLSGIPNYNPTSGAVPTAPIGANETSGLNNLNNRMNDPTITNYLNNTINGQYLPGQAGANPFLNSAIESAQRPTWQGLYDTLSKTLPGRFTQAGQFTNPHGSSAFDMAAARAGEAASNTAGGIAAQMSSGAYTQERANQNQAVQLSQQDVQTTISSLQAQALPRLIQQYGIDQGLQLFQTRIQSLLQALGVVTQTPLQTVSNTQKSSGSSFGVSNPFSFNYGF